MGCWGGVGAGELGCSGALRINSSKMDYNERYLINTHELKLNQTTL